MKSISSKAIVAVMTAALGLGAIAPAMAQPAPPAPDTAVAQPDSGPAGPGGRPDGRGPGHRGGPGAGGFLDFTGGSEAIEIALVRLSHRIDLTDAQTGLLDTLKTSALSAADDFETATADLRPTPPVEGETPVMKTVPERLADRIAVEKAQLAALEAVQPSVVAFFDSLTDEQKAELMPQPGEHGPGGMRGHGDEHKGPRPGFKR